MPDSQKEIEDKIEDLVDRLGISYALARAIVYGFIDTDPLQTAEYSAKYNELAERVRTSQKLNSTSKDRLRKEIALAKIHSQITLEEMEKLISRIG